MFGFREFEEDPFFRDVQQRHRQQMASMNSMFTSPFFAGGGAPLATPPMLGDGSRQGRTDRAVVAAERRPQDPFAMSPFGMMGGSMGGSMGGNMFGGDIFSNMRSMMGQMGNMQQSFDRMANDPNSHSFSSTSYTSYSNTGEGAPKVYQASSSTRKTPEGLKETRKTVRDSESGTQKMAIGHHLGDRAHVIERKRNTRTGEQEENQELVNLDETEAEAFDREFTSRTGTYRPGQQNALRGPVRHNRREYPALPDSRRDHRDTVAGSRHHREERRDRTRDRTPPRPTGPSSRGRHTHDGREEGGHHRPKNEKSVKF